VRPGVVYWRTAAREKLLIITDYHWKHATYIIFQLKSLVSILMHLCNMLLELGNWYRHPDLWHWERYATIKLFPTHAGTEVATWGISCTLCVCLWVDLPRDLKWTLPTDDNLPRHFSLHVYM